MRRFLALVPLAAVLLAGCGGDGARDAGPVALAAERTGAAESSRIEFESTVDVGARTLAFTGTGVFAHDEARGRMTVDLADAIPGSGDGTVEIRLLGEMVYVRLPAAALEEARLPAGKPWVAFDLEHTLDAAGMGVLAPSQLQQDPAQALRLLRAASVEVEEQGRETVRGLETTRYSAVVDLRKALDATADELGLDEAERRKLDRAARALRAQAGIDRVPVEVFVDDEGLLRRHAMDVTLTVAGERAALRTTTDYFDFGARVDVEAPPAAQVHDLSGLMKPRAAQG